MADITITSPTLKINMQFVDGDTRTLTLKYPKDNITQEEIIALQTKLQTEQILIGDKNEGAFGKFKEIAKVTTIEKHLDIS